MRARAVVRNEFRVFELEFNRLLVGPAAGEKFLRATGSTIMAEKEQVNYIFDTEDRRLDRARYALRLRKEGGGAWLTAKGRSRPVEGSTVSRLEAESGVDHSTADDVLAGRVDPVAVLRSHVADVEYAVLWEAIEKVREGRPLKVWGHFSNWRRTAAVRLPSGTDVEWQLDRTTFPDGHVDDEVEIEMADPKQAREVTEWVEKIARKAGVETMDTKPKIARFFASIGGGAE
jgi:uncharacterized protein YjbK